MPKTANLSASIVTSSIWGEPSDIRIVWISMLVLADETGRVRNTIPGLARLANVSEASVELAIKSFLGEDKHSRTKNDGGRRIKELSDGWKIINYSVYHGSALVKENARPVKTKTGVYLTQPMVSALQFEWAKKYKTDLPEVRLRKELNALGKEDTGLLVKAFRACLAETPAQFFSFQKFRDAWRSWLPGPEGEDAVSVFQKILQNHTGYSPAVGVYWDPKDVLARFGERAYRAFEAAGGSDKFKTITNENMKWTEREFIRAYEK